MDNLKSIIIIIMDLELLNFWISDFKMSIQDDNLFLHLKSYKKDTIYSYILPLSDNRQDILNFFGYDNTVEYDKMTQKNQFEFLCTSTKLNPKYISYLPFKTRANHIKFNVFLLEKYKYIRPPEQDRNAIKQEGRKWKLEALNYFNKENDYRIYKQQCYIFESLENARNKVYTENHNYKDFEKFMLLHGITNIIKWNYELLIKEWKRFKNSNWSPLSMYL